MKITRFKDLQAWKQARVLANKVYGATDLRKFVKDFILRAHLTHYSNQSRRDGMILVLKPDLYNPEGMAWFHEKNQCHPFGIDKTILNSIIVSLLRSFFCVR